MRGSNCTKCQDFYTGLECLKCEAPDTADIWTYVTTVMNGIDVESWTKKTRDPFDLFISGNATKDEID